jgi:hypothetical protein
LFPLPINPGAATPSLCVLTDVSLTKRLDEAHDLVYCLSTRLNGYDRRSSANVSGESTIIDGYFHAPVTFGLKGVVLAGKAGAVTTEGILDPGCFARLREQQAQFEARITEELVLPGGSCAAGRPRGRFWIGISLLSSGRRGSSPARSPRITSGGSST